ncbi:hypothetical protein Lal_00049008 [Lupinus albus]|nr:hypothetical protein Lal_00049008 [Lupinus albus]
MVQPQNKKKKHSIETRATDSNAVITLHINSSTIETLMRPDHLNNLRGDHLGVMYDATISGHLITDEPPESSNVNHRNADAIRLYSVSTLRLNKVPFSCAVYKLQEGGNKSGDIYFSLNYPLPYSIST